MKTILKIAFVISLLVFKTQAFSLETTHKTPSKNGNTDCTQTNNDHPSCRSKNSQELNDAQKKAMRRLEIYTQEQQIRNNEIEKALDDAF